MKNILRHQKRSSIISAVITIIMGAFLIYAPGQSVQAICTLLGTALAVIGGVYIFGWIAKRRQIGFPVWFLIPGIIIFALGMWLITNPQSVVVLIQYIFAAILIFHGIIDLQGAWTLAKNKWQGWWIDLLLSALTLILGVVVFINPFGTFETLAVILGASLIFDGVSDLVIIYRITKAFKSFDEENGVIDVYYTDKDE